MSKKPDAVALLAALRGPVDDDGPAPHPPVASAPVVVSPSPAAVAVLPVSAPRAAKRAGRTKLKAPRSELKHFGGYLDDETTEKVALLRIRLKLENSDLIKLAIEDLYRKHSAKRAFGDV